LYNGKGGTYGRLLDNPNRDFVAKLILSMGKDNPVVRMNREVLVLYFLNSIKSFWLKMIAYGELKQENYTAAVTLAVPSAPPVLPCIIINIGNFHTILKGLKIELLQEGSFRSLDFLSFGANLKIFSDLDLSLDDLGRDVESMEEVDLRGIKSSGSSRTAEINRRDNSNSCLSGYFICLDFQSELMDGGIGEDECNFIF
jgi:hypothetical protein